MANKVNAADILAFFQEKGMEIPEAVSKEIEKATAQEREDEIFHRIDAEIPEDSLKGKGRTDAVENFASNANTLAGFMFEHFRSNVTNTQGRGSGQREKRNVSFETEYGTLSISLVRPVTK